MLAATAGNDTDDTDAYDIDDTGAVDAGVDTANDPQDSLDDRNDSDVEVTLEEAGNVVPVGETAGVLVGSVTANGTSAKPTIALCTVRGKIKRVALSAFANIRQGGLLAMSIADGDELTYVRLTSGEGEVLIVTAQGQALRFGEGMVRQMGRTASGVRAMRLKKEGDYIAGMEVVEPGGFLLTVTEKGYGKCTQLAEYGSKGRGGSGMRTMTGALDVTGLLVAARVVKDNEQITVMSAAGTVLRAHVKDIPKSGRAARGSRLINLRNTDVVAAVARLQQE